ncbi:MAG: hypothetical protein KC800_08560 [Candidatus Eremiobacteraeota bacterium]|nr:hypothetical protein [Candidatus Eremiobacteraeota bacterium]
MNAIREIPSAKEVEVLLQSNEVFVHLPQDTSLYAVPNAIYDAGYAPDENVWMLAQGTWTPDGFKPVGWETTLPTGERVEKDGLWELHFKKEDGDWGLQEAKPLENLPVVEDEDI